MHTLGRCPRLPVVASRSTRCGSTLPPPAAVDRYLWLDQYWASTNGDKSRSPGSSPTYLIKRSFKELFSSLWRPYAAQLWRTVAHRATILSHLYIWSLPTAVPVFPWVFHASLCTILRCCWLWTRIWRRSCFFSSPRRHAARCMSKSCRCKSDTVFWMASAHLPTSAHYDYSCKCSTNKSCTGWDMASENATKSTVEVTNRNVMASPYTGCNRRNGPDFGRLFLRSNYTDITQNTYIQSSMVTEILAREVWNIDSYYSLIDYQIHI